MSSEDVPRKSDSRATPAAAYSQGGLESARDAVLEELRDIPMVPILELTDAVLAKSIVSPAPSPTGVDASIESASLKFFPTVTDDMVARVVEKLEGNGVLTPRGWRGFERQPETMATPEIESFDALEPLFDAVVDASDFANSNLLRLKVVRSKDPRSAQSGGYLILKTSSVPNDERTVNGDGYIDHTDDVVVFFQFRKFGQELAMFDSWNDVVWNMHHCMREDARRRFVYGVTFENHQLRLWYHDRSTFLSSTPFDWTKKYHLLVKVLLGFAACKSNEQLGYDQTIRRISTPLGSIGKVYEIDVRGPHKTTTFITLRVIADFGADAVCGRGTRVWAVVEKNSAGVSSKQEPESELVLKDCWVDADREREGSILATLKTNSAIPNDPYDGPTLDSLENTEALAHDCRAPHKAKLPVCTDRRRHFLDVEVHGDVMTTFECSDQTHLVHRGGVALTRVTSRSTDTCTNPTWPPSRSGNRFNSSGKVITAPTLAGIGGVPRPGAPIGQEGSNIHHNMQHYRLVFKELATSFYDLHTYRNIFTCLLGAVEGIRHLYGHGYVHRDISSGNVLLRSPKGGSPGCGILIDLEYAKRIAHDGPTHDAITGTRPFMSVEAIDQVFLFVGNAKRPKSLAPPVWRHLPIHDLESVWWLLVWAAFKFGPEQADATEADKSMFGRLFVVGKSFSRIAVCSSPTSLENYKPSYADPLWEVVESWRVALSEWLHKTEATFVDPKDDDYQEAFTQAITHVQQLLSLDSELLDAKLKHMAL